MKQIVVVKPKSLTTKDRANLSKNGYIVIEYEIPSEFRIIGQIELTDLNVHANDLFMSVLYGLTNSIYSEPKSDFAKELYRRLKAKENFKP